MGGGRCAGCAGSSSRSLTRAYRKKLYLHTLHTPPARRLPGVLVTCAPIRYSRFTVPAGHLESALSAKRVLSFSGTLSEFTAYLRGFTAFAADSEQYEFELFQSIVRHPAGKRLGEAPWQNCAYSGCFPAARCLANGVDGLECGARAAGAPGES